MNLFVPWIKAKLCKKAWFCMIFLIVLSIMISIVILLKSASGKTASETPNAPQVLSFKSVVIAPKDTLWKIAKKYYTKDYGSVNDYIREIKRCNAMTSDRIYWGKSLIVPIYFQKTEES